MREEEEVAAAAAVWEEMEEAFLLLRLLVVLSGKMVLVRVVNTVGSSHPAAVVGLEAYHLE